MRVKKLLKNIICFALCAALMLPCLASASVLTYETQYEYASSDIAWLSDLTVKLGLDSVANLAQSLTLIPVCDYPYRETAQSFKNDVDNYSNIYLLNENSPRAAYIYLFDVLASVSGSVAGELSDSDIAAYLTSHGVNYTYGGDNDSAIIARALYTALATGAISGFTAGSTLEELAVEFIENLSGMDSASLSAWLPEDAGAGLDEYILAACKCALWNAGYDVDENTDETTVYKLIACMVIEQNGITADTASDFNTLKLKFLAAMLAKKYGVTPEWATLGDALESDGVALYLLRLIGRNNGVAVGSRDLEDAFSFVAENSDVFDLEKGEFYADIYRYGTVLPKGTDSVWINAQPVNENGTVIITANGQTLKNAYYTKVPVDASAETQTVEITVNSVSGSTTASKTYTLTFYSGDDAPELSPSGHAVGEAVGKLYLSGETLLAGVLAGIGLDTSVSGILDKSFAAPEVAVKKVMGVIAPTFGDDSPLEIAGAEDTCIAFLDKIGQLTDSDIAGISGIEVLKNGIGASVEDAVTFDGLFR